MGENFTSTGLAEYPKVSFTYALKFSPWDRKKIDFQIFQYFRALRSPWIEARILSNGFSLFQAGCVTVSESCALRGPQFPHI